MEKVLRIVIAAAALWGGLGGNAAISAEDSPKTNAAPQQAQGTRPKEFSEMNIKEILEDAAARGFDAKSPELFKIQKLSTDGMEILAKAEYPGRTGMGVAVGAYTLKRGGSGDLGFIHRIYIGDIGNRPFGELLHTVVYPGELKPRNGARLYSPSPALAYIHIKESGQNVEAVLLQDRQLWVGATPKPEDPSLFSDEQRKQKRAAMIQRRVAAGESPDVRIDDFTLLNGTKYYDAVINSVQADGVTIEIESGIVKIKFDDLPAETRAKYGYDGARSAAATEANMKAAEAREAMKRAQLEWYRRMAANEPAKKESSPTPTPTPAPRYSYEFEHPDLATVRKYVLEAVFRDSTESATRWNQIPLVSSFGAMDEEQRVFLGVVDDINTALGKAPMKLSAGKETVKLAANEKLDLGAAIHVYFCDSHEIAAISVRERFRFSFRLGISWEWRNDDFTLKRCVVIIPRNQIDPKYFRHTVLTQMMSAIGLDGWPKNASLRSIYSLWNVDTLQPNDARLIALLYGHVAAGMNFDQVKQAVNRYWEEPAPK